MDNKLDQPLLEDSNDKNVTTLKETFIQSLYLGCISFGGPVAHIGLFRQYLIKEKKSISENRFAALFTLSNILPGPTSSQLYTVISTINSNSLLGGIISFIGFNFPSLIIVLLISSLIRYSKENNYDASEYFNSYLLYVITIFSVGLAQGALAIVIQAGVKLGNNIADTILQKVLLVSSAALYFIYNSYYNMIILMILSGIVSLLFVLFFEFKEENKNLENYSFGGDIPKIKYTGTILILVFYALFISLTIAVNIYSQNTTIYLMDSFYKIGSLIFGGGHVVIPMILSEFTSSKHVSELDVINGFTLISLLPGPMFNIAGYIGTLINGLIGGLLSAICIFSPGILLILGIFPFLNYIKNLKYVQIFLKGVSSASIGFIFTAALTLWFETCFYNKHSNWLIGSINVAVSYAIIMNDFIAPYAILSGAGVLFVFTLLGLN